MTKFFAVFSLFAKQMFRGYKTRPDGKKSNIWVAFLILAVYFLAMLVFAASLLFSLGGYVRQYHPDSAFAIVSGCITMGQLITLFFGLSTILNTIYSNKDAGIVLPLPISGSTIFAARAVLVYLQEFFISALAVLFFVLPFGLGFGVGAGFYLGLLPTMILMPVLPLGVGFLVAFPLSAVSSFLKNKGFFGTLIYILIFGFLFGVTYLLIFNAEMLVGEVADISAVLFNSINAVGKNFYPNVWAGKALVSNDFGSIAANGGLYLGVLLVLFVAIFFIARTIYARSLSKDTENGGSVAVVKSDYKQDGKMGQLLKTDFKNLFRDNKLGFFCLSGAVLTPIVFGVMSYFFTQEIFAEGGDVSSQLMPMLVPMLILMLCSTNAMASTAISRDRELFYIYKYMPIDGTMYASVKVLGATIIEMISAFLSLIVLLVFGLMNIWQMLLIFVLLSVLAYGNSCLQVLFDAKHPRLKWTSLQEGLKNNSAALWSILLSFLQCIVIGAPIMVGYFMQASYAWMVYAGLGAALLLVVVYALISQKIAFGKYGRLLEEIE